MKQIKSLRGQFFKHSKFKLQKTNEWLLNSCSKKLDIFIVLGSKSWWLRFSKSKSKIFCEIDPQVPSLQSWNLECLKKREFESILPQFFSTIVSQKKWKFWSCCWRLSRKEEKKILSTRLKMNEILTKLGRKCKLGLMRCCHTRSWLTGEDVVKLFCNT